MLDFSQLDIKSMYGDYISGTWTENKFNAWLQVETSEEYQQVIEFINGEVGKKLELELAFDCWYDCYCIQYGAIPNDEEKEEIAYYDGLLDKVQERVQDKEFMISLASKIADNDIDFKGKLLKYYKL